ncbi:MAG TPA: phage portal protein, partial [Flavobacterium sp.]|nr:phage portal protein [Flavobacterium sp.]
MENKNKNDIRLIQLNNYVKPNIEENKSKNWVLNGRNNSFYQYLIDRYNGSPTNASIINSYIDMIYAGGLSAYNSNTNTNDWIKLNVILKSVDLRKIISDFVLFNEFSWQVIKTRNKKDLGRLKHLPKERVAPSIENEDEEIEYYWYSRNWKDINKYKPLQFPAFSTSNEEIEIYNGKPYKAGKVYFADPDYLAGLPYCEMEEEISNYYINHIKNGLSFGYIINIPDGNSLSTEEKDELENKIKNKLTGSSNAGKFVLSFNGRDAEITVTPLQINDAHKQWEYLTSESRQQIMTSHRVVSPMLFGIKDNTGFGNNAEELNVAREQLIKFVIEPKQRFILDSIEEILQHYGINLSLYFKPTNVTQQTTQLNANVCCSDEKKKTDLDFFIDLGEEENLETYDLIDEI